MSARPRQSGLSLIEILVTMALVSGCLLMVARLFEYGTRMTRSAENRNVLQGERLKATAQIQRAMAGSPRSGNTAFYMAGTDDLALSIIVQDSWDDAEQRPLFGGYKIYYRSTADDTLRLLELAIAPTEVVRPLTEAEVRSAITADPGAPILENLSQFELYLPTTGVVTDVMNNPVGVRLVQQTARETFLTTEWTYRYVLP